MCWRMSTDRLCPGGGRIRSCHFTGRLSAFGTGKRLCARGSFRTVSAEKGSRLYVYERRLPEESVLVAMNMEENDAALMPEWLEGRILWQRGAAG